MPATHLLTFTTNDLADFSAASFDRNPLHLDVDYARKSAYGERVVFGVLGVLEALGQIAERPGLRLATLTADFSGPMFADVAYALSVERDTPERITATIQDGPELLLRVVATFTPGGAVDPRVGSAVAPPRQTAAQLTPATMPGASATGAYYPAAPFAALVERLGLVARGFAPTEVAALLWSSYLIGMELPGERAVFSRLQMQVSGSAVPGAPLDYDASVTAFDERFNLARIKAHVGFAELELRAFVRDDLPRDGATALEQILPRSDALDGRVALVTGGSRGLGAALVRALASQGCTVLANYLRGREDFERLAANSDRVIGIQGDASDPAWNQRIRERVQAEHGGLDILVCNAALPLRPMALHPNFAERLSTYVSTSLALASTPMSTLLDLIADREGWNVVISSAAVVEAPPEWPHYVAAKSAIEGLTRVAALQRPDARHLIVRPPRLLTDLTNTPSPLSRAGTLAPEIIAVGIVRRLLLERPTSGAEVLDTFA